MGRYHIDAFCNFQTWRVGIHNEGANASSARRLTRPSKHHVKIGNAAVRNPSLETIQAISLWCVNGTALHGGHIGARIGLTQGKGCQSFALGHSWQVGGLLLGCALEANGPCTQTLHGKRKIG